MKTNFSFYLYILFSIALLFSNCNGTATSNANKGNKEKKDEAKEEVIDQEVETEDEKDVEGTEDEDEVEEEVEEKPDPVQSIAPLADADPFKNGHPNLEAGESISTKVISGNRSGDGIIGQIKIFAGNFAPRGWMFCNGQLLSISGNESLYSIIGTTYGGDGRTSFGLPDLRGRTPVHAGKAEQVRGDYKLGKKYGRAPSNTFQAEYQEKEVLGKLVDLSDDPQVPTAGVNGQASLGIHYIIATSGIFPSRN